MVILLVFVINPFINFTGEINGRMHFPPWLEDMEEWMRTAEENAERLTRAFLEVKTTGGLLFNLLMVAVLPAIGEELLFRGVIQKQLSAWSGSHHWGIWLSAALFSALHMQFYGFLPRMLLGALFGYLLGLEWLPVAPHSGPLYQQCGGGPRPLAYRPGKTLPCGGRIRGWNGILALGHGQPHRGSAHPGNNPQSAPRIPGFPGTPHPTRNHLTSFLLLARNQPKSH